MACNRDIFTFYNLYHTNHPDGKAHGGSAILIKEKIEHYELSKYEQSHIEATSIKVQTFPYAITITATQEKQRQGKEGIYAVNNIQP
jgi:intein-encoded DNA endonuclease-like protein